MNLQEFVGTIEEIYTQVRLQGLNPEHIQVGVVIKKVGSVGPTPYEPISHLQLGIDWDRGKVQIFTKNRNITTISDEDIKEWSESVQKAGWDYYERRQKTPKKK